MYFSHQQLTQYILANESVLIHKDASIVHVFILS